MHTKHITNTTQQQSIPYRACHLTNDTFVISTNYAQFIHIHWKGHVQLTCQLNLKNKAPPSNANSKNASQHASPPVTPSTPNDNPNVRSHISYSRTPGELMHHNYHILIITLFILILSS